MLDALLLHIVLPYEPGHHRVAAQRPRGKELCAMERRTRYDELSRETNLDQLEGAPSERADVLMETEAEKFGADVTLFHVIRLRFSSITSSRSPAGVALAILMLASAAVVSAAAVGLISKYAAAPGWLTSVGTLAV